MTRILAAAIVAVLGNGTVFGMALDDLRAVAGADAKNVSMQAPAFNAVEQAPTEQVQIGSFSLQIGDKVIADGDPGRVAGISSDGRISVRDDDGTYGLWKPERLALRKGCSMGLCVGDRIVSTYYAGKVAGVYANGWLSVRSDDERDGYFTCYGEKEIARRNGCSSGVCVGDTVIPEATPGTVEGMFSDGKVSVRIGDAYRAYDPDRFARTGKRECSPDGFCVGEKVMSQNGNAFKVAGIFPRGRLSLSSGEYYYNADSDLAKTKGCSDGICVGDRIVTSYRHSGRVAGIFHDGTVLFYRDDYAPGTIGHVFDAPDYFRETTELIARTRGCSGGFCVGAKVIASEGAGKVAGVFSHREYLSVRIQGEYYDIDPDQIAKREGCSGQFCVGDKAINTKNGYAGRVSGVFQDGRVSLNSDGKEHVCATADLVRSVRRWEPLAAGLRRLK
ncbi:MAG: hypothetical protein HY554_13315 [Elusimicrobia bacterium]|nr:hypothetical protein [Elusimicrobiota bacterium]